ncbi:MAG: caspase family protein [Candidatus Rokubacteria bacterium]|nr:caspase family protein [Candidatus Rokubacteria bacterium]
MSTTGARGLAVLAGLLLALLAAPAPAATPTAKRPTYALGDKWIRSDAAYELVRIEGGEYVFAAGPRREIRLTRSLGFSRIQKDASVIAFDPAHDLGWPLRVGAFGVIDGRWSTPRSGGWGRTRTTWSVEAYEDVEIPAGTFKAFRISYGIDLLDGRGNPKGRRSITTWYAPEVQRFVKATSPDVFGFNYAVVSLDRPEPLAVALAAPAEGARTNVAEAPLRARVSSGQGVTKVVVTLNGVEVRRVDERGAPKELPLNLVLTLREGRNVVLVSATDAGGETRQEARTLVYARPPTPTAVDPTAERPGYAIGDRWIREDGVFRLVRIEDGRYVFSAGPRNEVHFSERLGFAKWVGGTRVVAFDPPLDLEWPLRVGASGVIAGRWTTPKSDGWRPARTTWRVDAYEDVATPVGTLKAFRITYSVEFAKGAHRSEATVWYAPEARRFVKASSAELPVFSYSLAGLDRPAPPAVATPGPPPAPPATAPPVPALPPLVARPAPLAVRLASPADQARVEHDRIALAGVVTGGTGVARVLVTLNGAEVARAGEAQAGASVALNTSLTLREGRNTVVVTATDGDGTVLQEVRTVTYEKRVPLTVELRYPDDGARLTEAATVVVGTAASSRGLTKVSLTLNGAEILPAEQGTRGGQRSVSLTVPVTLRAGANVIVVGAADGEGQVRQVVRTVTYEPPGVAATPAAPEAAPKATHDRWAVVIGVSAYEDPDIPRLKYAMNDAEALYRVLTGPAGFKKDHVMLLTEKTEKKPTLRNIKWALGTFLARSAKKEDTVLIFYAGHGAPEVDQRGLERDGLAKYLIPADADPDDLFSTALPMDDIQTIFGRIEAERVVTFVDACYSGAAGGRTFGSKKTRAMNLDDLFLERLTRSKGRAIITASRPSEVSLELAELRHGIFTYYLVRGLEGAADLNRDGIVTLQELYEYVEQQVSRKARAAGGKQNPVMKGELEGALPLVKLGR